MSKTTQLINQLTSAFDLKKRANIYNAEASVLMEESLAISLLAIKCKKEEHSLLLLDRLKANEKRMAELKDLIGELCIKLKGIEQDVLLGELLKNFDGIEKNKQ